MTSVKPSPPHPEPYLGHGSCSPQGQQDGVDARGHRRAAPLRPALPQALGSQVRRHEGRGAGGVGGHAGACRGRGGGGGRLLQPLLVLLFLLPLLLPLLPPLQPLLVLLLLLPLLLPLLPPLQPLLVLLLLQLHAKPMVLQLLSPWCYSFLLSPWCGPSTQAASPLKE